jgi:hypothetical protein
MLQREKIIQYLVGEITENGGALQQEGEEPNHGAGPGSASAQETEGSGGNVCTFYGSSNSFYWTEIQLSESVCSIRVAVLYSFLCKVTRILGTNIFCFLKKHKFGYGSVTDYAFSLGRVSGQNRVRRQKNIDKIVKFAVNMKDI